MLCSAIAAATTPPERRLADAETATATPSGKLCAVSASIISSPRRHCDWRSRASSLSPSLNSPNDAADSPSSRGARRLASCSACAAPRPPPSLLAPPLAPSCAPSHRPTSATPVSSP